MDTSHHIEEAFAKLATTEDCRAFKRMLELKAREEGLTRAEWNCLIEAVSVPPVESLEKRT